MTKYFILNPEHKEHLKYLVGDAPDLGAALKRYVSMWRFIMDAGMEQNFLSVRGSKRLRKKKLKTLLKRVFIEEFLSCMTEQEISDVDSIGISGDLSSL